MNVLKNTATALHDLLVVEIGERVGASACGSLLAQLGADVVIAEPAEANTKWKWRNRVAVVAGKRSIRIGMGDDELLRSLLEIADVILIASDVTHTPTWNRSTKQIVCNVTAFGNSGPLQGEPYTDALVQAISGVADTTGNPTGPPILVGLPILEFSAGIYAASAIIAALRVRGYSGSGQDIDIALFDCAISALATFLPFPISGKAVTRAGNKHSLASPWNAYRAVDGWVLICTATDDHWARLCKTIKRPLLINEVGYATNTERIANADKVDSAVEQWTIERSVDECIRSLGDTGIACGPILTVSQLHANENLLHRDMIRQAQDTATGLIVAVPGSPIKASITPGRVATVIGEPDSDRAWILALINCPRKQENAPYAFNKIQAPYAGLRVVEIGQFTTAPLVSRQLAALGAEVIKLEPPGGEGSRNWPPHQGEQGYFFTFSNSDKRSVVLDLSKDEDKQRFRALLQTADVLVENLKPGALARLGFDAAEIQRINQRVVYCAISGFGLKSIYPGRPAFDTVVQAMCGFMDLTRAQGTPTKSGISAADIIGGELALLAIVAAIEYRDHSGFGQHIDISMQDAGVWATQMEWASSPPNAHTVIVECADGYLAVDGNSVTVGQWLACNGLNDMATPRTTFSHKKLSSSAKRLGLVVAPVNNVAQVLHHPQVISRKLVLYAQSEEGLCWPLLNSPLRLAKTPPAVRHPIGKLGEGDKEILAPLDAAIGIRNRSSEK